METRIELKQGWKILQDVHDTGEKIGLYAAREADTSVGSQVSEWEELEELKHLQLIYARQPYFGRELRYFNRHPGGTKQSLKFRIRKLRMLSLNLPMWIIMEKYGLTENFLESMKDIPLHFPLM